MGKFGARLLTRIPPHYFTVSYGPKSFNLVSFIRTRVELARKKFVPVCARYSDCPSVVDNECLGDKDVPMGKSVMRVV